MSRHLEALQAGQVKIQVLAIYVQSRYQPESSLRRALLAIDALYRDLAEGEGAFHLVRDTEDLAVVLNSDSIWSDSCV